MPGTNPDLTTGPSSSGLAAKPALSSAPSGSSTSSSISLGAGAGEEVSPALRKRRESTTFEKAKEQAKEIAKKEKEEFKLKEFVDDEGHFSLVRNFRLADIVTLGNGFCGSMSLFSSANYLLSGERHYLWAALAYPVAGAIFDALDGKVARWRNESSMLGQELDSLADSISFGVAPAFLAFTLGLRTPVDTLILTTFICCGIARLARFNATVALVPKDSSGKSKYFEGLPIPSSLAIVTAMAVCVKQGWLGEDKSVPGGIWDGLESAVGVKVHKAAFVFLGWGMLMISKTLRVPKF